MAGWMYFFNWACTSIVDVTAIALYMHYWGAFKAVPQWTIALIAMVIVLTANTISVKLFGEMEFWAALIKVVALVTFLVVGIVFPACRFSIGGQSTGLSVIADNGGTVVQTRHRGDGRRSSCSAPRTPATPRWCSWSP